MFVMHPIASDLPCVVGLSGVCGATVRLAVLLLRVLVVVLLLRVWVVLLILRVWIVMLERFWVELLLLDGDRQWR